MTTYDVDVSLIESAIKDIRDNINDHQITGRYDDKTDLTHHLAVAYNRVLTDLNTVMSGNPVYVTHDISFNTTDKEYLLPTGVGGVAQLAIPDLSSGRIQAIVPALNLDNIVGPNWTLVPPFLRLAFPFNVACTGKMTFVPKAQNYMMRATWGPGTIIFQSGTSTFTLKGTTNFGSLDKRPNAYVGGCLRITQADVPVSHGYFPVVERIITAYEPKTYTATLNKPLDYAVSNQEGVPLEYEVVPLVDPAIMHLASIEAARFLCNRDNQVDKARQLAADYEIYKTAVRRNYQNVNSMKQDTPTNLLNRIGGPLRPRY